MAYNRNRRKTYSGFKRKNKSNYRNDDYYRNGDNQGFCLSLNYGKTKTGKTVFTGFRRKQEQFVTVFLEGSDKIVGVDDHGNPYISVRFQDKWTDATSFVRLFQSKDNPKFWTNAKEKLTFCEKSRNSGRPYLMFWYR